MMNLLNEIGENNGYELILQEILNKESWLPIDIVHLYMESISKVSQMFHREFALEYIPKLKDAVL